MFLHWRLKVPAAARLCGDTDIVWSALHNADVFWLHKGASASHASPCGKLRTTYLLASGFCGTLLKVQFLRRELHSLGCLRGKLHSPAEPSRWRGCEGGETGFTDLSEGHTDGRLGLITFKGVGPWNNAPLIWLPATGRESILLSVMPYLAWPSLIHLEDLLAWNILSSSTWSWPKMPTSRWKDKFH